MPAGSVIFRTRHSPAMRVAIGRKRSTGFRRCSISRLRKGMHTGAVRRWPRLWAKRVGRRSRATRPENPCRARHPQYPQTQARSLAGTLHARVFPLPASLYVLAQPDRRMGQQTQWRPRSKGPASPRSANSGKSWIAALRPTMPTPNRSNGPRLLLHQDHVTPDSDIRYWPPHGLLPCFHVAAMAFREAREAERRFRVAIL